LERNGWFIAFEKAITDAKASKDGIVSSESYKEELEKLRKFPVYYAQRVASKNIIAFACSRCADALTPH
jgi:hypothetical protein